MNVISYGFILGRYIANEFISKKKKYAHKRKANVINMNFHRETASRNSQELDIISKCLELKPCEISTLAGELFSYVWNSNVFNGFGNIFFLKKY